MIKIKILRESKGLTQQQLADMLDISRQTVQKYEAGTNEPDIKMLKRIADIFEVSVDFLIDHRVLGNDPNYPITEKEFLFVEQSRKLSDKDRGYIFGLVDSLSSKGRS